MACNCNGFTQPTRKRGFGLVPYSPTSSSNSTPPTSPLHPQHSTSPPHSPQIGQGHNDLSKYITKMDEDKYFDDQLNYVQARSKHIIENLPDNPEELLRKLFQNAIDETIAEAYTKYNLKANMLGVRIDSILLDTPIGLPIREITPNTADALLNLFMTVEQSKTEQSLYGAPFSLTVIAVERQMRGEGSAAKRPKIAGGLRKWNPKNGAQNIINKKALINFKDPSDHYCLFYALQASMVRSMKFLDKRNLYRYLNGKGKATLQKDVKELLHHLKVPLNQTEYNAEEWIPKILDFWNGLAEGKARLKAFIFGPMGSYKPIYKYGPNNFTHPICIYWNEKHFEGVKTAASIFDKANYCFHCEVPFKNVVNHRRSCQILCLNCGRHGHRFNITKQSCPVEDGFKEYCEPCGKTFTSSDCYKHHLKKNHCRRSARCGNCGVIYDRINGVHECGSKWCQGCKKYHKKDVGCFIDPIEPIKPTPYRTIVYDLETMQNDPLSPFEPGKRKHVANFIAAKVICNTCIANGKCNDSLLDEPCSICGPNRTITFSHCPFQKTKVDKQVITENPLEAVTKWLLYEQDKKYTTVAWAHNAGRFDAIMVFSEVFKLGINPDLTKRGNKLYQMVVPRTKQNGEVIFRDSLNLVPLPLASLPPAFGLKIADKQFFPYLANRRDNYGVVMKGLPPKSEYLYGGMTEAKKKKFDEYHEANKDYEFLLDEELPIYCLNDVQILTAALIAFQKEFLEISRRPAVPAQPELGIKAKVGHEGIDCLRDCCTISSACLKHYKMNHLKPGKIGFVPHMGYDTANNQSGLAFKFLHWYGKKHGVQIRTGRSIDKEHRIGPYWLDGWVEAQKLAIEVHGCVWHACPTCYPDDQQILPSGWKMGRRMERTAGKIREIDNLRTEFIRERVGELKIFYECQIKAMLNKDPEMRRIFSEYMDDSPINVRRMFMGGRTGPLKIYHEAKPGHKIVYFDVTSMYPHANHTVEYPIGHPELTTPNKDVDWQCAADNPYKLAMMKVWVVPPRRIDVPILPVKFDDRLLFPLCKACALAYPQGKRIGNYICLHRKDHKRGWISECTSMELDAALENGYRVKKVFRVLEYAESDAELFKGYIAEFMALKIHATDFPSSIKGSTEKEDIYIKECWDKFGIKIEREKMAKNPAKRQLAKLCLNNLWGRFSLRNGLSKVEVIDTPDKFTDLLWDRTKEVVTLDPLRIGQAMITYQEKEEFVSEHKNSAVPISLWTTSHSRLHLLRLMQQVSRIPGAVLLYSDTDSLVYSFPCNCGSDEHSCPCNPLQIGTHLGELTDEYPDHDIVEVVFAGCKNYALKLHRRGAAPDEFEYVIKVRGITLNWDVEHRQGFRYDVFKEMALNYARTGKMDEFKLHYPNMIRPSLRTGTVVSQPMDKIYRPYIGKGIVTDDFHIREFGYIPPSYPY